MKVHNKHWLYDAMVQDPALYQKGYVILSKQSSQVLAYPVAAHDRYSYIMWI